MGFCLNYIQDNNNVNNGTIEVCYQGLVIDSWAKHDEVDFKHYCIIGDADVKCDTYRSRHVSVPSDSDSNYHTWRIVVDEDAYKKCTSDDSKYCCVYVADYDSPMMSNTQYGKCRTATIYGTTGKLTSFEGQSFRCAVHHFTFLKTQLSSASQGYDSDDNDQSGECATYLAAATDKGVKVYNLADIDNSNVCWSLSPVCGMGVAPITASGKKYFVVSTAGVAGSSDYVSLLDYDRFVKGQVYDTVGYSTEMNCEQDVNLSVSKDMTGLKVSDWYRDRFYDWDTVVKFGCDKLLWYETCVIKYSRYVIGKTEDTKQDILVSDTDYLAHKLFSPSTLSTTHNNTTTKLLTNNVTAIIDDDCMDSFLQCCEYSKPTIVMLDQPYDSSKDGCYFYDDSDNNNFMALYNKSIPSYINGRMSSDSSTNFTHTVKVAVFDDAIPSLTDYFENYDKVVTPNNTFTITGTIVHADKFTTTTTTTTHDHQPQLVLHVSKCV